MRGKTSQVASAAVQADVLSVHDSPLILRIRPGLGIFRWPELLFMTAASFVFIVWWLAMAAAMSYTFWSASPLVVVVFSPVGVFPPAVFAWALFARWTCFGAVVPRGERIILARRYLRPGIPLTTRIFGVSDGHRIIVLNTSRRRRRQAWCIGLAGSGGCELLAGEYGDRAAAESDAAMLAERLGLRFAPVADQAIALAA